MKLIKTITIINAVIFFSILIIAGCYAIAKQQQENREEQEKLSQTENNLQVEIDAELEGLNFKCSSSTLEVITRLHPEAFELMKDNIIIDNDLPKMRIRVSNDFRKDLKEKKIKQNKVNAI